MIRRPGLRLLIGLDIDGTVAPDGTNAVPAVTRQAVADVVGAGHTVVLATGRSLVGVLPVAALLGLEGSWVVSSNGAVLSRLDRTWPSGYRVESATTLDVEPVLHLARRLCPDVRVGVEQIGWGYNTSTAFDVDELNGRQLVMGDDELTLEPVPRIILSAPNAATLLLEPIRRLGVSVNPAGSSWLDVTPPGTSKAEALERVRKQAGIDSPNTVFVGDGINDREAMAWAEQSWSMGHAPLVVQEAATYVTGPLAQHGAAMVLRGLLAGSITESDVALAGARS
ncbi:Cof-type HAD-IIB family hydrolase [Antribacter sp. KLBMP9083]|uniref:Cof-type HAD-IIB family hydrolase n=1 Tax=Antribacter soli TaxID=2910976 RepID=A0AA41QH96_9MICO|nr:HAD family hydrolase [Antribacter soli]MCF4122064.1 Cof-type HAD-IIB family hydrolase [Antribacter soli]